MNALAILNTGEHLVVDVDIADVSAGVTVVRRIVFDREWIQTAGPAETARTRNFDATCFLERFDGEMPVFVEKAPKVEA